VRSPRRAPMRVSWAAAADAFILVSRYTVLTRTTYRSHLQYAGELLGDVALSEVTSERLGSLREAVLERRRGAKHQVLTVARVFLRWSAEHGLHQLGPESIDEALRGPGVARGSGKRRNSGRRQPGLAPPPTADPLTLAAFGYPPGVGGLAQVAEEMHAFREALQDADPVRWAKLLRATEHPVNRPSGKGSAQSILASVLDAASGKRRGADAFLVGLGYPERGAGERRLLGSLQRLRAAFVDQQNSTLGRTTWRASWSEVAIPIL
jgi:hypothetical protein